MKDMLGRQATMEPDKALELITKAIKDNQPKTARIPIEEAAGRIVAEGITSQEDIPGFARSTMDGYAVLASDTFGATETSPAYLDIEGEILMGQQPASPLSRGKAIKIATGGMLPEGADAVLMFEYAADIKGKMIEAQKSVAPGENVIQKGEDMAAGDEVVNAGTKLRPQDIAVLASAGITEVMAYNQPTIAIISTGDEIIPPSQPLKPGLIRDSNSYQLAALAEQAGAVPVKRGIMADDYDIIRQSVKISADENDIILITGGSSVGTKDMTERVITDMGELLFHSVQLKPGKPFMAGTVNGKLVFGLPGHPRAVAVCFETFVRPVLRMLSGQAVGSNMSELARTIEARLTRSVHSSSGRREHIDVILVKRDGELWAEPVPGKSGLLRTMLRSEGSICVPLEKLGYDSGQTVTVTLY